MGTPVAHEVLGHEPPLGHHACQLPSFTVGFFTGTDVVERVAIPVVGLLDQLVAFCEVQEPPRRPLSPVGSA